MHACMWDADMATVSIGCGDDATWGWWWRAAGSWKHVLAIAIGSTHQLRGLRHFPQESLANLQQNETSKSGNALKQYKGRGE